VTAFERLRLWARRLWNRTQVTSRALPPEPFDEASARLDVAVRRTRAETRHLQHDGSELAERIRRNARAGRGALEGKP
jgi:hypothetical protein